MAGRQESGVKECPVCNGARWNYHDGEICECAKGTESKNGVTVQRLVALAEESVRQASSQYIGDTIPQEKLTKDIIEAQKQFLIKSGAQDVSVERDPEDPMTFRVSMRLPVTPPVLTIERPEHMSDEEWRGFLEEFANEWREIERG